MITSILVALTFAQAATWTPCPSLLVYGTERLANGAQRPFMIQKSGDALLIETTRALDGYLAGATRREYRDGSGVLTWLPGRPQWALRRAQLSVPDYESMLKPPPFDREDLKRGAYTLSQKLAKQVQVGRMETIGGKACYPLRISDRSAASLNWWIDPVTGILLKAQEAAGDTVFAERTFTDIKTDSKIDPKDYTLPGDVKTIRGLVSGGVLERADSPRTEKQYDEDLAQLRSATVLGDGRWVKKLPKIEGFDYILSERRENRGSLPPIKPEGEQPAQANVVTLGNAGDGSGQFTFQLDLAVRSAVIDGSNLTFTIVDPSAVEAPIIEKERAAGASGIVQSDFLDRKTGDTVSFIQFRNAGLGAALRGLRLPPERDVKDEELGEIALYDFSIPFKMTMLCWHGSAGNYALSSTSLSEKRLIEIARRIHAR